LLSSAYAGVSNSQQVKTGFASQDRDFVAIAYWQLPIGFYFVAIAPKQ
jgi:hypothetical protein